ncbi:fimbria/pilus outer membrane usher protein, partial [Chitinimonas sp.]|uniref:fimbria/pilus outer membrane usher protein n=1 Tax=Chitinimonas sp. TaxID=1934313 RepID=UPI0035B4F74C
MPTICRLAVRGLAASALIGSVQAASTTFESSFLHDFKGQTSIDVSQFEQGALPPGRYPLDLYLNDQRIDQRMIDVTASEQGLAPCLGLANLPELAELLAGASAGCLDLPSLINGARVQFDPASLRLDISVPTQAMQRIRQSSLRRQWDSGIDALLANYNLSFNHLPGSNQLSLSTQLGANLGPWRLRTDLALSHGPGGTDIGKPAQLAYGYREIRDWNGQLMVGNALAGGSMLGSGRIYGMQFHTDTEMDPNTNAGLRPRISGIARTNALVRVYQFGNLIYSNTVPPGNFLIDDLPVLLGNQDLLVRIEESDGRVREFNQPIAVLPSMRAN